MSNKSIYQDIADETIRIITEKGTFIAIAAIALKIYMIVWLLQASVKGIIIFIQA